jgi:hypothetical protein
VQALGACWDDDSKRWYTESSDPEAQFSKWLPPAEPDEEFTIVSTDAYVAAATTACRRCHAPIEVICILCKSGTASGDPLTQFTVSNIWTINDSLAWQLQPWANFRKVKTPDGEVDYFANHCPHCDTPQDDMYLHSEPDEPFFDIPHAAPGTIKLTPLAGAVRLSGDEHFEVQ